MDNTSFVMAYSIDESFDSDRFLKLRLRVCHDGESPNHTYFTEDTMREANKTLEYIPLLAHVYVNPDTGKPEFGSHDSHVEEDKLNPGESKLIYDEVPIGVIPSLQDNNCTIEEFEGKQYVFVDAYVWNDYANYAEDLIRDIENCKISMEIDFEPDAMKYDDNRGLYMIYAYRYRGITVLNNNLGTGMKDAMATTATFNLDDIKTKMSALMEELIEFLRGVDINKSDEKGVEEEMNKFEELLAKYSLTAEELDFEYEGVSDEELEVKFTDFMERRNHEEETPSSEEVEDTVDNAEFEEQSTDDEPIVCEFKLSHEDTRYALQKALRDVDDKEHYYTVLAVYDKHCIYMDYASDTYYKRSYKVRKNAVSFDGEPEEVFAEFVTSTERDELDKMRANYAGLVEYKENAEREKDKAEKDAVFASEDYAVIVDTDEFKELVANSANYSVSECSEKADVIFAKHIRKVGSFAKKESGMGKVVIGTAENDEKPKKAYGNLFD